MSVSQLPLISQSHRNQQLFSDYYLNVILPKRADWQRLAANARPVMAEIAAIFASFTPSSNEAQTENDLVRPVLAALGHTFEVQTPLVTPAGTKKPDYTFYRNQAGLNANKGRVLTDTLLHGKAFAVGDAKYWNRPLDVSLNTGSGDPFTNRNPSFQIAFYIQHSGLDWGILTNGRLWRLYHRETAHKLDRYYEVDLPALLETNDVATFLYFYAFFHRAAFDPQPLGVAALLQASTDYARGVSDSLKTQVFEALRHLAQGFLDYPANRLQPDPATLQAIYDNSLIVLYRLLFILYAEARELLPLRESPMYRQSYSLSAITHEIARDLGREQHLLPTSALLWPRLKTLFQIIDTGSPPLKVATFNGGLFDPERHPFLEQYAVGDAHLQRAIDTLARVNGEFVDYRDLAEHHLGTIYEGLLEHHLEAIPPEDGWTVATFNDRGERKATGSYYTPNYIVKYIVGQTLGSVLRAAVDGKPSDDAKIKAVLGVNVLDPAMGSGYFLVEATEYIARFLVDQGVSITGGDSESDLAYWKRRVVQSCIYGVDLNPLAVDLAKLSLWLSTVARDRPLSFLDHHLRTGNSLVGARVADLQPDPGKAGTRKRAGTKAKKAAEAGQLSMLEDESFRQSMSTAVSSMWLIEGTAGNTVEEVKEQERVYAVLRESLTRKYGRLADLATATHFGLEIDPAHWQPLADYATGRTIAVPAKLQEWLDQAERIAERDHFFHWELEFPEVFFDRNGQPLGDEAGFDAVIGNPPYVRSEHLKPFKPYFESAFAVFQSSADLYLYFYERGIQLLQQSGRMAYISSGTFARGNFATAFRKLLPTIAQIESVIDFGENQPFEAAEMVRPSIVVLTKGQQESSFRSLFIDSKVPESLERAIIDDGVDCDPAALQQPEWVFQPAATTRLFAKILAMGQPLEEVVNGQIFYGIKTSLDNAFVIDQVTRDRLVEIDPASMTIIKPVLRGEDLRPWYQEDEGRWMIVLPSGWTKSKYGEALSEEQAWDHLSSSFPGVADYLEPWADAGRKRWDQGEYWWELRSCDYYWAFDEPKIFWPDIAKLPRFSLGASGMYITTTGYLIPQNDAALLGILQSRALWFAISQICQPLRLRAGLWQYRVKPQYVSRLPIPNMDTAERETIGGLAMAITEQAKARYDLHRRARHRIESDLGTPGKRLNQKLTAWWTLDFPSFRAEIKKVFKHDIPLRDRDDWEACLDERRAEHERRTAEIVRLETELNARVYALFDLTPAEIQTIEQITKYRYGEV